MNLFVPMLVTGLLTSFHCVMMCGNLVLTYAIRGAEDGPLARRMLPHLAYHGAKVASYVAVGLLLGSIGTFISAEARSWVSVVAGAWMVILGLSMTGRFPALHVLTPRPPEFLTSALKKLRRRSAEETGESPHLATPAAFGAITGLMPCGPLQAAQLAAAGSGSAVSGATMMLGFGLGTIPLMLFYGGVASYLSGRFKRRMGILAAVAIIILGLVMLDRGATALGSPLNLNALRTAVFPAQVETVDEYPRGADGGAEVALVIENTRYVPGAITIPADEKVRIVVDRREANACSDELWIPALGVAQKLTPNGETVVEVPASKAGTYQMTCQMGMMSGTVIAGAAGPTASRAPILWVLAIGAAIAGGVWLYRRRQPGPRSSTERAGATRVEIALIALAVLAAVLAGLMLGGYFK